MTLNDLREFATQCTKVRDDGSQCRHDASIGDHLCRAHRAWATRRETLAQIMTPMDDAEAAMVLRSRKKYEDGPGKTGHRLTVLSNALLALSGPKGTRNLRPDPSDQEYIS